MTKQIRLQVRRDTSANWASANPVLADGEIGYDTTEKNQKIGDGTTTWSLLPWTGSGGDVEGPETSVANCVVTFADATGKVLKDSGFSLEYDEDKDRYYIANDIMFRNMNSQNVYFRNMGYVEDSGVYKYPMTNPSFWNSTDGIADTTGWTATAGANVTVNSTTVVEDASLLGDHSWRINITVTQVSGSVLTIKKTGCQNLGFPKRFETAHKWGVTPDATTRMDCEIRSDNQWERWQYPQFTVQAVTQWRNPALSNPVLDEDFEDFDGEEIYVIYTNLPVGTYDLTFGGVSAYGDAIVYIGFNMDSKSRAMGIDIRGDDDGPVTLFSDRCPVLRLSAMQADAPSSHCMGDVWIDTTATPVVKLSDGTNWIALN